MAITHTWEITNFEKLKTKDSYSNVVSKFSGKLISVDDVNDVTIVSEFIYDFESTELGAEWTVNSDTFTPFESLTQSQVEGWIDVDFANDLKAAAESRIAMSLNTEHSDPPW